MQRESTWKHMSRVLGKTTVTVRTTNLLNLSKPKGKKKEGRERGEEKRKIEVKEREGRGGRESRGGRVSKCSLTPRPPGGLDTRGVWPFSLSLIHEWRSPLTSLLCHLCLFTCVFSVLVLFKVLFHLFISCTWFKMAPYTQP